MADTGPIFSTLPTSSSSTLEKIPPRSVCRAFAVQRYWASPVSSSSRSMITAVSKAEATALAPSPAVMAGDATLPRNPEMIRAKAARPTSTANFKPVIKKIHLHRPFAMRRSVLFNSSILPLLPLAPRSSPGDGPRVEFVASHYPYYS